MKKLKYLRLFEQSDDGEYSEDIDRLINKYFNFNRSWIDYVLLELVDMGYGEPEYFFGWKCRDQANISSVPIYAESKPVINIEISCIEYLSSDEKKDVENCIKRISEKIERKSSVLKCSVSRTYNSNNIALEIIGEQKQFSYEEIFEGLGYNNPILLGTINGKQIYDIAYEENQVILTAKTTDLVYSFVRKNSRGFLYLTDPDTFYEEAYKRFNYWEDPDYHYDFSKENQMKLLKALQDSNILQDFLEELGTENEEQVFKTRMYNTLITSKKIAAALESVSELAQEFKELYSGMLESAAISDYCQEVDEAFEDLLTSILEKPLEPIVINGVSYFRFRYWDWYGDFLDQEASINSKDLISDILFKLDETRDLKIYGENQASVDYKEFNEEVSAILDKYIKK